MRGRSWPGFWSSLFVIMMRSGRQSSDAYAPVPTSWCNAEAAGESGAIGCMTGSSKCGEPAQARDAGGDRMETKQSRERAGPRRLPVVRLGGVAYFVDLRLREFRTVARPGELIEFIAFDSKEGRRMSSQCAALECMTCGQQVVVRQGRAGQQVACVRCRGHMRNRPAGFLVA